MFRPTRRHALFAVALGVAVGCAVVAGLLQGRDVHDGEKDGARPQSLTISGDLPGLLSPGMRLPLNLSIDNRDGGDLTIDQITVTVSDVDAPLADARHPCGVGDFVVRQLAPDIAMDLAAGDRGDLFGMGLTRAQWPVVGMVDRPVNQDGCKEALLTLTYQARGSEVAR